MCIYLHIYTLGLDAYICMYIYVYVYIYVSRLLGCGCESVGRHRVPWQQKALHSTKRAPHSIKRALHSLLKARYILSKEPYVLFQKSLPFCQKNPAFRQKSPTFNQKSPTLEVVPWHLRPPATQQKALLFIKRAHILSNKSPTLSVKNDLHWRSYFDIWAAVCACVCVCVCVCVRVRVPWYLGCGHQPSGCAAPVSSANLAALYVPLLFHTESCYAHTIIYCHIHESTATYMNLLPHT